MRRPPLVRRDVIRSGIEWFVALGALIWIGAVVVLSDALARLW